VHKSNLGSQLSIFDTGSSARARPRPNDPPERVQPGALKRPARTTETKRQGRAGQTSCTSVHKANLGSQLSIFDTGSSARARPRPNDPPERVQPGALKRPARTTETKRQGRAGQTSCTSVHKANLRSQLSIFDTGSSARARPRPNDPPERVHPGALKRPARTTHPNEFTRAPSNDPPEPERPARTSSHGRPQTTRPNDFSWAPERPKRTDKGEPGKRAARTCTKPTSGHNLAFLIRPSPERPTRTSSPGRPQTTRPNDPPERLHTGALKRPTRTTRPNDPPERVHTGALKRPARTTHPNDPPERVHTGALKRPTRTTCPNEFTRVPSNDPPERTTETNRQGRAGQTSCTNVHKANLGSQLSIFDTALARTTHPNEFTRAPSNDPPERPTRTTSHGRPQTTHPNDPPERPTRTTRPNEVTRAPSNDPPERPTRTTCPNEFTRVPSNDPPERTTETNRQGRAGQTSCTNVHKANLGSQLSIFDTALARTSSPGRPRTTRPNDPPERVHTGALKRPARTTHPNDPPERVHKGALKRPARTIFHGRPNDRNEPTRESRANELHERAQSQPRVTT
jgi:hypothetical protein